MAASATRRIPVMDRAGVVTARESAATAATDLGFPGDEPEEIAIVVSELAANLVRHAHGGVITIAPADWGGRPGLEIVAEDDGPGIPDVERAIADGYSGAGGLGAGLGAVNRLTDDMDIRSTPGRGTRITCYRWLRADRGPDPYPRVRTGVATRSRRGSPENGDAFVVRTWPGNALIAVIDGLGHGKPAQRAAHRARAFVERHTDVPLATLFRGTGRACLPTRGVVMAAARIDTSAGTLDFAGVGDVEARLLGSPGHKAFVVRRGILGLNAPDAHVTTQEWTDRSVLVLHSDGLRSRWTWTDFPAGTWDDPQAAAITLIGALGKDDDDATVVVVRGMDDVA